MHLEWSDGKLTNQREMAQEMTWEMAQEMAWEISQVMFGDGVQGRNLFLLATSLSNTSRHELACELCSRRNFFSLFLFSSMFDAPTSPTFRLMGMIVSKFGRVQ